MRWGETAFIELPLSLESVLSSDTLEMSQTYATVTVTSSEQRTAVRITISESNGFSRIKALREGEEKVAAERIARELAAKAAREEAERTAREKAEKKEFILAKLGDVRSLLNMLESVRGDLAYVRCKYIDDIV